MDNITNQLVKEIKEGEIANKKQLEKRKAQLTHKTKEKIPTNADLLRVYGDGSPSFLKMKPTRSISGVSVIAVMTKPASCPGKCIYCPRGEEAPQSYTGYEPAARRAKANEFDPHRQVKNRIEQLQKIGHDTSKCELIIMGGTFPAIDWENQKEFVKRCFDAFNQRDSKDLKEAQKLNEKAENRVVGLTVETRPDFVFPEKFLELGATRVEIGVQTVYDDIFRKINRGHGVKEVIEATKKLKDAGLKVCYHMMIGLPGSNLKKDFECFKELIENEKFRPDMLKIYPTLVIEGTELYKMWKGGKYKPLVTEDLVELLKKVYSILPKWIRIMRVQRDIPADHIRAGPVQSNLRELVEKNLKGINEIRFREVGHVFSRTGKIPENVEISIEEYSSSGGKEFFISAEDKKEEILVGFLRLRFREEDKIAIIRELHIFGSTAGIGKKGEYQHQGWGKKLLEKAEEISKKAGKKEILITSGVGAREYYRKFGYTENKYYMWKNL